MQIAIFLSLLSLSSTLNAINFPFRKTKNYPKIEVVGGKTFSEVFKLTTSEVLYENSFQISAGTWRKRQVKANIYSNQCYDIQSTLTYSEDEIKNNGATVEVTFAKIVDSSKLQPEHCDPDHFPWQNILGAVKIYTPSSFTTFEETFPISLSTLTKDEVLVFKKKYKKDQYTDYHSFIAKVTLFDPASASLSVMPKTFKKSNVQFKGISDKKRPGDDIILKTSNGKVYADSSLILNEPEFLLNGQGASAEEGCKVILASDFDKATIAALLQYAATSSVKELSTNELISLYFAANAYRMNALEGVAIAELIDQTIKKGDKFKISELFTPSSPIFPLAKILEDSLPLTYSRGYTKV